jgi:hypothetical protein
MSEMAAENRAQVGTGIEFSDDDKQAKCLIL